MPETFKLTITTPKHTFFENQVKMLVFEADDGRMGVLAGHQPMVVSLLEGILRIQLADGSFREAAASSGFATVLPDAVDVLLQTAEWAENIDAVRAQSAVDIATEHMRQQKSLQEYQLAKTMLARAMVRLRITSKGHND